MKTKLKISSVNSLTDGRYFAASGAEWLGFRFDDRSPRSVSVDLAKEIKDWLSGPRFIAEFNERSVNEINEIVEHLGTDCIQTAQDLNFADLSNQIQSVIHYINISNFNTVVDLEAFLKERSTSIAQFVLDFRYLQEMKMPFWEAESIRNLCQNYPIFIKWHFDIENILPIVNNLSPFGLDLEGGNEIGTGLQAFDEVSEMLRLLETS